MVCCLFGLVWSYLDPRNEWFLTRVVYCFWQGAMSRNRENDDNTVMLVTMISNMQHSVLLQPVGQHFIKYLSC